MKILVTGGCGYIGSHTIVSLLENKFEVICADNNIRSDESALDGIEKITGKRVKFYKSELCNWEEVREIFEKEEDIGGIIHFAALKTVPESVEKPLEYHRNNIDALINMLEAVKQYYVPNFVFSSSCSVYGNAEQLPVTEATPVKEAESPYARTKQIGEDIIRDFCKAVASKNILLRYFNPVGAHESALIGEKPVGPPNNLIPRITGTAIGKYEKFSVFGNDYDTRDGSCIRDYIHVMDIAEAHVKAIQYLIEKDSKKDSCEVFNLGTGKGVSVLEMIDAFEKSTGQQLNYEISDRRPGDVVSIYADNTKARTELGWTPQRDIENMMKTAWEWEQNLAQMVS